MDFSWTNGTPSLSTARYELAGAGTQTLAISFRWIFTTSDQHAATELYNGSSWTAAEIYEYR
jgi:hypothetical protein